MTDFARAFIFYIVALICAIAMLFLIAGCTPFISELSDSSGCLWTTGGPVPGLSSGEVVVCRSGKDNARVLYQDQQRAIVIMQDAKTISVP